MIKNKASSNGRCFHFQILELSLFHPPKSVMIIFVNETPLGSLKIYGTSERKREKKKENIV